MDVNACMYLFVLLARSELGYSVSEVGAMTTLRDAKDNEKMSRLRAQFYTILINFLGKNGVSHRTLIFAKNKQYFEQKNANFFGKNDVNITSSV
jgi:hypothetical protein